jgi:hypothetical protein
VEAFVITITATARVLLVLAHLGVIGSTMGVVIMYSLYIFKSQD